MTAPTHRALTAFCLALAAMVAHAAAQPAPLPDDLIAKSRPTQSDIQRINAYAQTVAEGLRAEDPDERETARRAAREPLSRNPTPSFRIEYGAALQSEMQRLAAGPEDDAVFALMLAGDLATVGAHDLILRRADHESPAVRYAAARAARLQLDALGSGPAAIGDQARDQLVTLLERRVQTEQDPAVLDGLLTAASDAVRNDTPWCNDLLERLAAALAQNIASPNREADRLARARAQLRLVGAIQLRFRNKIGNLPNSLAEDAALLAGHVMGDVLRQTEDFDPESHPARADALGQLVKAAYNLAFFAYTARTGRNIQADDALPQAFNAWRDGRGAAALRRETSEWIGDGGLLTEPPFNAAPGDFNAQG